MLFNEVRRVDVDVLTKLFGSLISFGFWFKIRRSRSEMATSTFCPMVRSECFTKLKRDTTPLLTFHPFILAARRISKFSFAVAGVSLKAVIEEVSICVRVSLSLSSRATCVPLFDEHYISLQENIFLDCTASSRTRFTIGEYLMSPSFRDCR
jgi:hypothetical protein